MYSNILIMIYAQTILQKYNITHIFISLLLLVTLSIGKTQAQVTIGSGEKPNQGTLLDLKQYEGKVSSSKGLGLPRVELTSKKNLYPMFEAGYDKTDIDPAHIGLVVYATKFFDINNCPGTYVWNGIEWDYLLPQKKEKMPVFTDGEGNTYTYAKYGDTYWMTQNVRTVTKKGLGTTQLPYWIKGPMAHPATVQGVGVTLGVIVRSMSDITQQADISYVENGMPITSSFSDYISRFGLMYNYEQALDACPDGWRLPNYTDWKKLLEDVGASIGVSTNLPAAPTSQTIDLPQAINEALKYPSANIGSKDSKSPIQWKGVSICDETYVNLLFNVLPAGAVHTQHDDKAWHFANGAFFWIYDNNTITGNVFRISVMAASAGNIGEYQKQNVGYSIRCVRDTAPN